MNIEELKRLADRLGLPTENGNRLHDLSFWLDSPPAVPEMTDDALKEILNAAQIVGYDDPLCIVRGFAMRVLQEWGNQEGMHKAFLDAVNPAVAVPAVPTDEQIHAAYRNALGQSIRERDMPEIRKFARALLQSAAVKESLTAAPDCRTCANRGQVNGLSQESYCDSCIYQGRDWRKNHFVDASKMADAVNRRCDACAVLPCSCK